MFLKDRWSANLVFEQFENDGLFLDFSQNCFSNLVSSS